MPAIEFDYSLLRELTEAGGVPGYEDEVREIVRREFTDQVDSVRTDTLGNVIGTINGSSEYCCGCCAHG